MKISLTPVRMDETLTASVMGDILIVNGLLLDFSMLEEGSVLLPGAVDSDWIRGVVARVDGEIHLMLAVPHGADAPQETRFPAERNTPMTIVDGLVPLPPYDTTPEVSL